MVTATASVVAYVFWYKLLFFVGSYLFIHWLGLIATAFVAVSIPIHHVLKRRKPRTFKKILNIHVFGNLCVFLLISVHFAQNFGRLAGAVQRLGVGFALYLLLSLIVATGIVERYQSNDKVPRYVKGIHKYAVVILYLLIIVHLLEGFNIL